MKYKVGDRVKIIDNDANYFEIGEIAIIDEIDDSSVPYKCSRIIDGKEQWLSKKDIELVKYTWEDFLKAPIGTKVTFENGETLVKADEGCDPFINENHLRNYEDLKDFRDNAGDKLLGKIIKIEEPTYTTVYEPKEITMPEIEEMKRLTDELCKTCDEFIKKIKENKDE